MRSSGSPCIAIGRVAAKLFATFHCAFFPAVIVDMHRVNDRLSYISYLARVRDSVRVYTALRSTDI